MDKEIDVNYKHGQQDGLSQLDVYYLPKKIRTKDKLGPGKGKKGKKLVRENIYREWNKYWHYIKNLI